MDTWLNERGCHGPRRLPKRAFTLPLDPEQAPTLCAAPPAGSDITMPPPSSGDGAPPPKKRSADPLLTLEAEQPGGQDACMMMDVADGPPNVFFDASQQSGRRPSK